MLPLFWWSSCKIGVQEAQQRDSCRCRGNHFGGEAWGSVARQEHLSFAVLLCVSRSIAGWQLEAILDLSSSTQKNSRLPIRYFVRRRLGYWPMRNCTLQIVLWQDLLWIPEGHLIKKICCVDSQVTPSIMQFFQSSQLLPCLTSCPQGESSFILKLSISVVGVPGYFRELWSQKETVQLAYVTSIKIQSLQCLSRQYKISN